MQTGAQAECYANAYIGFHMAASAEEAGWPGATYATLCGIARGIQTQIDEATAAGTDTTQLTAQLGAANALRDTMFRGETSGACCSRPTGSASSASAPARQPCWPTLEPRPVRPLDRGLRPRAPDAKDEVVLRQRAAVRAHHGLTSIRPNHRRRLSDQPVLCSCAECVTMSTRARSNRRSLPAGGWRVGHVLGMPWASPTSSSSRRPSVLSRCAAVGTGVGCPHLERRWRPDARDARLPVGRRLRFRGQGRRFWPGPMASPIPRRRGPVRLGGATGSAFARIREGVPAEQAGGIGEQDLGNGSLMRILPLALVGRDASDAELIEQAHRSSAITHGHPVAQATCALYCLVARRLLAGDVPEAALAEARMTLRVLYAGDGGGWPRSAAWDAHRAGRARVRGRCVLVPWDAFAGADGYRATIERAIRYGHDTDTTACIAAARGHPLGVPRGPCRVAARDARPRGSSSHSRPAGGGRVASA